MKGGRVAVASRTAHRGCIAGARRAVGSELRRDWRILERAVFWAARRRGATSDIRVHGLGRGRRGALAHCRGGGPLEALEGGGKNEKKKSKTGNPNDNGRSDALHCARVQEWETRRGSISARRCGGRVRAGSGARQGPSPNRAPHKRIQGAFDATRRKNGRRKEGREEG